MRINSEPAYIWRKLNESVQNLLGCESKVYIYPNSKTALLDISMGLHLRLGHKKKMIVQLGLGDHGKSVEFELSRLGVRFKKNLEDDLPQEEKQVLAYVHDLDDAVTAQLFDNIEILKILAPTRIYKIHLAHHLFRFNKNFVQKLSDLDVIVANLSEDYTLVFTGEKSVVQPMMAENLGWNLDLDLQKITQELQKVEPTYQEAILHFENNLPAGITPWFTNGTHRLYDRSAIVVNEGDGSAFIELLSQSLNIPIKAAGSSQLLEATSPCRWSHSFNTPPTSTSEIEKLRGLVIIHGSLINEGFLKAIEKTLTQLIQLSS